MNSHDLNSKVVQDGVRTAAFLLIIPGFLIVGAGIGLALANPAAWAIMGLGAGLIAWGLIVVFRKRD